MTKKEYIDKLQTELGAMSYNDVRDIVADIEEHFEAGIQSGKTESEISGELGSPESLAADYREGMEFPEILRKKAAPKKNVQEPSSGTVVFCILITLFVAIPSWVALLGIILTIFTAEIAAIAGCLALLITCWGYGTFFVSGLLGGLTLLFLSIFGFVVTYFAVKYFILGTKWYIAYMKKTWHEGI